MKLSCYNKGAKLAVPYLAGWDLGDVLLCCPGPSLSKIPSDINRPGLAVAAINTAYPKVRPDIWFGMDVPECYNSSLISESFIKVYRDCYSAVDYNGRSLHNNYNTYFTTVEEHPEDFIGMIDFNFPFTPWYKNTLAVALHLLMWMGAKRIFLAGCDMGGDKDYWDDRELSEQEREKNRRLYGQQVEFISKISHLAESIGIEIISSTQNSPLNDYLSFVGIEDLLNNHPAPGQEKVEHVLKVRASKIKEITSGLYWNEKSEDKVGVLVMADKEQEWMLPWWYENYSTHNWLPVCFVDIGMTKEMAEWCRSKGEVVEMKNIPLKNWFQKPYALMRTPFCSTIYMDVDCEVLGDITDMSILHNSISLAEDVPNQFSIGTENVNTGVIAYDFGCDVISRWAEAVNYNAAFHRSDQEILQAMLSKDGIPYYKLPEKYNWVRLRGENKDAVIRHWTGPIGKEIIKNKILNNEPVTA